MDKKKDLQPGERIGLVLRFLCGNCISPSALLPLFILITTSAGSFAAFYAILTQNKFLSFCTFVLGSFLFVSFFLLKSDVMASLRESYAAFPPISILAWITLIVFSVFVLHNLIWFLSWIGSFYLWTFYFPFDVDPFGVYHAPCTGSNTCWPYKDVPYGKFDFEFWICFAFLFFFQMFIILFCYFAAIKPIISIFKLGHIAVKNRVNNGDVIFDEDIPSIPKVVFRHVTGISATGKMSWIIIIGYFNIHLFVYSISWPDLGVSTVLRVLLAIVCCVNLSLRYFSRDSLRKLLIQHPKSSIQASFWINYFFTLLLIPFPMAFIGYLVAALFFWIDPGSSQFLFITLEDISLTPNFWILTKSFFNFAIISVLVFIATYIIISIVRNLKNASKRYKDYEENYLKGRNEKEKVSYA
ncbi:hypothetical protein GEMRC1_007704 [Eukaryota sp. GEM-RC1]